MQYPHIAIFRPRYRALTRLVLPALFLAALLALAPAAARADQAEERLTAMSLKDKVGQLFTVFFQGPRLGPELTSIIRDRRVGGLILYDISGNIESPAQVAGLVRDAQALACADGRPGLFISVDQEGGPVARLRRGFAVPPSNMAVGASGDPALAELGARLTARQLAALGVNMNFAPSVDVNSNPANPIIGVRSYGGDPALVGRFGAAAVRGSLAEGVIPVAKHFPGHGDTGFDSHLRLPTVPHSRARLEAVELPPFLAAIEAGVPAVMTAHVEVPALEPEPGLPATLSHRVLTGLLRHGLGYDGLIVTDSMTMGAVTERFGLPEAALAAFQAGADVLLFGADKGRTPEAFVPAWERLMAAAESGEISAERLDESVLRILRAKARFGIIDPVLPNPALADASVGTAEQQAQAARIAAAGLTLARRGEVPLPLAPDTSLLVLWPGAKAPFFEHTAVAEGFRFMALPLDPAPENIALAVDAAERFDVVAVFASRADKRPGQAALLAALAKAGLGPRTVLVSLDTPYDVLAAPENATWLAAYSSVPSSVDAVAQAFFGGPAPRGRIPVSIPTLRPE